MRAGELQPWIADMIEGVVTSNVALSNHLRNNVQTPSVSEKTWFHLFGPEMTEKRLDINKLDTYMYTMSSILSN
jgi:hypothetical protein